MSNLNLENEQHDHWNAFVSTGSVEDYLGFKQMQTDEGGKGAHPYAGNGERDRNDFEDGAYRGL
ncbi:MAG: hypothetical protein LBV33_01045 [Lachnospiraceae bacterium]|jgi:hypothetical protein|nr:hypothetical protein [Lachnospiraceae bacterium]